MNAQSAEKERGGHVCACSCLCFCVGVQQRPDLGCSTPCHDGAAALRPAGFRVSADDGGAS